VFEHRPLPSRNTLFVGTSISPSLESTFQSASTPVAKNSLGPQWEAGYPAQVASKEGDVGKLVGGTAVVAALDAG
jgi:hypothetical protein